MRPTLGSEELVFVSRPGASYGDGAELSPVASFAEDKGLTLVVPKQRADAHGGAHDGVFKAVTLRVHSSLAPVCLDIARRPRRLGRHALGARCRCGVVQPHQSGR